MDSTLKIKLTDEQAAAFRKHRKERQPHLIKIIEIDQIDEEKVINTDMEK